MKIPRKRSVLLGVLVFMAFGFQSSAYAADADKCTAITAVPFAISAGGSYCLTKDLIAPGTFTSGAAITVAADNVTIDLGGYTLSDLAAGTATTAIGIQALAQNNVTVENGTVRGFYIGIQLTGTPAGFLTGSTGHLVQNVRGDANRFISIQVLGTGSVVRQNQVLHTGGSTAAGVGFTVGIQVGGDGAEALDNSVVDTIPPTSTGGQAVALLINAQNNFSGAIAEGNRVANTGATEAGAVGIVMGAGAFQTLIVNNRVSNFGQGILFIFSGAYRDNITINVTLPYLGGTNAGNNQ
jgi:hypothetical protein